jgi:hypothetical protein
VLDVADPTTAQPVRAALRRAAPALLAYAAVRLLGVVVLASWGLVEGEGWHQLLSARWDSLWYTRIAEEGYGYTLYLPDGRIHSNLAFFPLLPWLERTVAAITPLAPADAGLAVSWFSSLAAAWGIFAVADRLYGRRTGIALAVLWAVLPTGIVQSMAYSESLFTALAAWAVYALLTRRWVWAGGLAALAGLTRPVGLAVVAAVWVTAAVALRPEGWRGPWRSPSGPALGMAIAPLGWLGYVAWTGARTGSPLGYLDIQHQWGNGFDGGLAFAGFVRDNLTGPFPLAGIGLLAAIALVGWLYVLCVRQHQPLPLLVLCGVVAALALAGSGYFGSKPRLLMPAFPLLLPPAAALARIRTTPAALILGCAALASAVYGAFWLHGSGPP